MKTLINITLNINGTGADESTATESFPVGEIAWEVFCGILCIPTVTGNVLILICIFKYNGARSIIHTLIGNLAVSDLIVGAILFPLSIVTSAADLNSHKYVCLTKEFIMVLSIGGTCYGLLLVSLDRFIAICYPMQYVQFFTKRCLFVLLTSGWCYVVFWACLPLSGWNFYDINLPYSCFTDRVFTPIYQKIMNAHFFFILFLNFVFYLIVIKIAIQKHRQINSVEMMFSLRRESRSIYKVKTMGMIQGVFLVCWLPYVLTSISLSIYHTETASRVQIWTLGIGLMNSSLNWMIYGYRNKELRTRMKIYLSCWTKQYANTSL